MAKNKKSAIIYCDTIHTVEKLSDENAGKLFKHFLKYVNDQNPKPENEIVDLVFEPIKQQLKRDLKAWEIETKKRRESGRKGGLARARNAKQKQGVLRSAKEFQGVQGDSVNVSVNVNEKNNTFAIADLNFTGQRKAEKIFAFEKMVSAGFAPTQKIALGMDAWFDGLFLELRERGMEIPFFKQKVSLMVDWCEDNKKPAGKSRLKKFLSNDKTK